jgi:hypothetical protein
VVPGSRGNYAAGALLRHGNGMARPIGAVRGTLSELQRSGCLQGNEVNEVILNEVKEPKGLRRGSLSDAQLDTRAAPNGHAGVGCVCAGRAHSTKLLPGHCAY